MKKVIDGKMLNTMTAKNIGVGVIDETKNIVEALYRTRAGVYFIHNMYEKSSAGNLEVGQDITLISADKANEWAAKWLTESEYNKFFGEGEVSDESTTITINISSKAFRILKKEKELTGDTYGEIVSYALQMMPDIKE